MFFDAVPDRRRHRRDDPAPGAGRTRRHRPARPGRAAGVLHLAHRRTAPSRSARSTPPPGTGGSCATWAARSTRWASNPSRSPPTGKGLLVGSYQDGDDLRLVRIDHETGEETVVAAVEGHDLDISGTMLPGVLPPAVLHQPAHRRDPRRPLRRRPPAHRGRRPALRRGLHRSCRSSPTACSAPCPPTSPSSAGSPPSSTTATPASPGSTTTPPARPGCCSAPTRTWTRTPWLPWSPSASRPATGCPCTAS